MEELVSVRELPASSRANEMPKTVSGFSFLVGCALPSLTRNEKRSLTDPRQLISGQHIHNARGSKYGSHRHPAWIGFGYCTDAARIASQRLCPHDGPQPICVCGVDNREQLAFV